MRGGVDYFFQTTSDQSHEYRLQDLNDEWRLIIIVLSTYNQLLQGPKNKKSGAQRMQSPLTVASDVKSGAQKMLQYVKVKILDKGKLREEVDDNQILIKVIN